MFALHGPLPRRLKTDLMDVMNYYGCCASDVVRCLVVTFITLRAAHY